MYVAHFRKGTTISLTYLRCKCKYLSVFIISVNVETMSMSFVLCIDYMMMIAGFFSSPETEQKKPIDPNLSVKYDQFPTSGGKSS